jgi:hypothetical protein
MPARMHLIILDLKELANGWEDDERCQEFTELAKTRVDRAAAEEEKEKPEEDEMNDNGTFRAASDSHTHKDVKKEVKLFFEEAIADAAKKHFPKEWTGPLMHFAVAGKRDTSVPFCKWLVNGSTNGLGSIDSVIHDTKIDLDAMTGFFSNPRDRLEFAMQEHVHHAERF